MKPETVERLKKLGDQLDDMTMPFLKSLAHCPNTISVLMMGFAMVGCGEIPTHVNMYSALVAPRIWRVNIGCSELRHERQIHDE